MANLSAIKLPNGTTYNLKDNGALQLTGGSVTGPVSFGDSVSIDEATIGDLVVNGSANFTNGAHGVIDKAKAADVTSTLNALVKYEDTEGTFSDSNIYNTSNNLIIGSTSIPGNIQIGAKNDNYGILPNTNNYNQIGSSSLYWYRAYIYNYYGSNSHVTNWDAGKNIGTSSTSSAAATLGSVYFYNACAAGGTQTKTLLSNGSATSNITVTLPSATGTLALTSQIPDISGKADKATTLSGYGITDAKIASGTITLGSNTITPLTSASTLDATKLSGTIPSGCYTNTNTTYTLSNALSSHKFTETLTAGGSGSGTSTATMTFAAGTGITLTDDTTNKKITIACSVTNTDTKLQVAEATSATQYYPLVGTGTTAATRQYDTTGFKYKGTTGTTSAVGSAILELGNSTASGTAGNKQAQLIMYGTNAKKATITLAAPSADIALALPTSGGTLALTSQIPTVSYPVTSVNSKTGAVSLTASDVGALASNTTYVSKITTTAGAHTAISNKSGAVSFNVPTKTSHLTNDSDFITTSAFKAMFASGHVAYSSIATNSYADKTVSFGKTFSSAPNVTACLSTSGTAGNIGNVSVSVFNITTTQCTVRVFNNRGSALSPAIEWIAVNV